MKEDCQHPDSYIESDGAVRCTKCNEKLDQLEKPLFV